MKTLLTSRCINQRGAGQHATKFDSSTSFTGLDFLARSLIRLEQNGKRLDPGDMAGNMTDEQREILWRGWHFIGIT
jgi:hypothetical protein